MSRDQVDIFVVDDDDLFREELTHSLERQGYSVEVFASIGSCRDALQERTPLVLLLDIQLPDGNGVEFLKEIASSRSQPEVVMVSGAASLQEAADSMKVGATDFIEKPFDPPRLYSVVNASMRIARLKLLNSRLIESRLKEYEIVGESAAMRELRDQILRIADTDVRILITGESGTGKELVAGQIHYLSRRSASPFVKLNCSALPSELVESELFGHAKGAFTGAVRSRKGRFERADGGTLLLDEIGDMPLDIQPKLLRVIETGEIEAVGTADPVTVDVRLVSSTNRDIEDLAAHGKFRSDLLYRINTVPMFIPPLRDHREDIPQLVDHFVERLSAKDPSTEKSFEQGAIDALMSGDWQGNARQLRNVVERLYYTTRSELVTADAVRACIGESDLAAAGPPDGGVDAQNRLATAVSQFEISFLRVELDKAEGNVTRLAERLGMDRGNLYRKLRKTGLLSKRQRG
jgi:two-component system nitrogen regulation response regulator NtrX